MTQKEFKQHVTQHEYNVVALYKSNSDDEFTHYILARADVVVSGFINLKNSSRLIIESITGTITAGDLRRLLCLKNSFVM